MISIVIELILKQRKQFVIGSDKFLAIFLCDPGKVADHPACQFELPLIRQTDKAILGCDIGKEWELPAAQRPEITLTAGGTQAGEQNHTFRRVCFEAGDILRSRIFAFVTAPFVPEVGALLEIVPFAFVRSRDRMTDVAAERFAAWVVRGALLPAVELGDRRVKFGIENADIVRGEIGRGFENLRGTIKHRGDSNKK